MAQFFCSYLRRRNSRIAGYVTIYATPKTDKKQVRMYNLLNFHSLTLTAQNKS